MTKFRTLDQAILLHRECRTIKLQHYLKDQMLRASSSVALNLSEGQAKSSKKDQKRFFEIAYGSIRELKTILELADAPLTIKEQADKTAAHLFKLIKYYSL